MTEPDPRNSLRHVLSIDPIAEHIQEDVIHDDPEVTFVKGDESPGQLEDADVDADAEDAKPQLDAFGCPTSNPSKSRDNNGSVSSVYSGNKIRHLKKDDGEPLWRKDIQYDFLRAVFGDEKQVFHRLSDGSYGHSFADIYLEAMARSSKCSKILKDKLLSDRPAAISMAMVCLLVNVGRMNTTLNFFPEMRAQLRTYHSIPSLQARQDPNAYKQLQDAPRLKSILKGATEESEQPLSLEDLKTAQRPRTNPVNLIFILAQYAPKVSELHFTAPRDFFDLVVRSALSSRSRANAFLWLMWWYLESDFSKEAASENPFGPGEVVSEEAAGDNVSVRLPPFEYLTEEQSALENVDTEKEKEFGELKRKERMVILSTELPSVPNGTKRPSKKSEQPCLLLVENNSAEEDTGKNMLIPSDDDIGSPARDTQSPIPGTRNMNRSKPQNKAMQDPLSDTDRTRSVSPPANLKGSKATANLRITTLLNDDGGELSVKDLSRSTLPSRSHTSRSSRVKRDLHRETETPEASSPPASIGKQFGLYLPLNNFESYQKKSRPLTAHQIALERYRKERVDYILDRRLKKLHLKSCARRQRDGAFIRAWRRCAATTYPYDSEEEYTSADHFHDLCNNIPISEGLSAPAGFACSSQYLPDGDDKGEEAFALAQSLRKAGRRLDRWDRQSSGFRATLLIRSADNMDSVPLKSGPGPGSGSGSARRLSAKLERERDRDRDRNRDRDQDLYSDRRQSPSPREKRPPRRKERAKQEGIEFAEPVVLGEKSFQDEDETEEEVLDDGVIEGAEEEQIDVSMVDDD